MINESPVEINFSGLPEQMRKFQICHLNMSLQSCKFKMSERMVLEKYF